MADKKPKPLPWLLELDPYVGGESKIEGVSRIIKLASNESAFGISPKAKTALEGLAGDFFRYPDGGCTELRAKLAAKHKIPADKIVCGGGSDDLISLLMRCYAGPGDEVLVSAHGFAMFPIYAKGVGATVVTAPEKDITVDVDALLARVTSKTRIVCVANPNNPTGTYIPVSEVKRLHAALAPDVLLLLDSAYAEYIDEADWTDGAEFVAKYDNVLMLRTFSKIYGLGGMRVGWMYGPDHVVDIINRLKSPFTVSTAAQAAAVAALDDDDFVAKAKSHNARWRRWTMETLRQLGLAVPESHCNFVVVRFPGTNGHDANAADAFLKTKGIIVRKMAGYGLPDALRITIGTEDEMRLVVDTLGAFMGAH
jgi:histidinol-phosphate aminotransferase